MIILRIQLTLRSMSGRTLPDAPLRWTQMEDGEEKLAAFLRETGLIKKEGARTQDASIPSRRGRIPWKLASVFLLLVFIVWSFIR